MNGWCSGALHFRGSPICKQGKTLMVSVCFCPPMVCCSVDQAVCLCAVCCGACESSTLQLDFCLCGHFVLGLGSLHTS